MFDKKMEEALNRQINEELASSYIYMAMSAYFEEESLSGCAHYMKIQAQEEMTHAMKIYDHIISRGGRVILAEIPKPQEKWDAPYAAFEAAYKHEQHITGCINSLVKLSREIGDNATEFMLQWYVTEQVEEEENAQNVLQKLKLAGTSGPGLYLIDQELGTRVFTPPAQASQN